MTMKSLTALIVLLFASLCWGQESQPTVDKKFLLLAAYNGGATLADAITTFKVRGPGSRCTEGWNPALYGQHPTAGRTLSIMGAEAASVTLVSYLLKRKRVHAWKLPLWPVPMAYAAYAHGNGFLSNMESVCR